jgi:hypothetical protein
LSRRCTLKSEEDEGLSNTHGSNFMWPSAVRSMRTTLLPWLVHPSSLSQPPWHGYLIGPFPSEIFSPHLLHKAGFRDSNRSTFEKRRNWCHLQYSIKCAYLDKKYTISRTPISPIGSAQSKLDVVVIKERTDNIDSSNSLQNEALEKPLLKTSIGDNLTKFRHGAWV